MLTELEGRTRRKGWHMSETGSGGRKLLIVGAHSGDFVWRAAGAIAAATSRGGVARVVALSYGERGESGDLWNEPDQTIEYVKRVRNEQAEEAARVIGASFECWDLGDYPLRVNEETLERLADEIREFAPHVVLMHIFLSGHRPHRLLLGLEHVCNVHECVRQEAAQLRLVGLEVQELRGLHGREGAGDPGATR